MESKEFSRKVQTVAIHGQPDTEEEANKKQSRKKVLILGYRKIHFVETIRKN